MEAGTRAACGAAYGAWLPIVKGAAYLTDFTVDRSSRENPGCVPVGPMCARCPGTIHRSITIVGRNSPLRFYNAPPPPSPPLALLHVRDAREIDKYIRSYLLQFQRRGIFRTIEYFWNREENTLNVISSVELDSLLRNDNVEFTLKRARSFLSIARSSWIKHSLLLLSLFPSKNSCST